MLQSYRGAGRLEKLPSHAFFIGGDAVNRETGTDNINYM